MTKRDMEDLTQFTAGRDSRVLRRVGKLPKLLLIFIGTFYLTKHRFELVSILITKDISRDNLRRYSTDILIETCEVI
jgi:hypothetical protein